MVFNEIMYVGTFEMFSEEYGKYAPWFNSGKRSTQLAFMQFPITTHGLLVRCLQETYVCLQYIPLMTYGVLV